MTGCLILRSFGRVNFFLKKFKLPDIMLYGLTGNKLTIASIWRGNVRGQISAHILFSRHYPLSNFHNACSFEHRGISLGYATDLAGTFSNVTPRLDEPRACKNI